LVKMVVLERGRNREDGEERRRRRRRTRGQTLLVEVTDSQSVSQTVSQAGRSVSQSVGRGKDCLQQDWMGGMGGMDGGCNVPSTTPTYLRFFSQGAR